ncbi:MAG: HEAT repeat domain-containing protein [Gammaproteobacteria bacterium]
MSYRARVLAQVVLILAAACSGIVAAKSGEGVIVAYYLESPTLTLHEPVRLTFDLQNRSDKPVKLDLGYDRKGSFQLTVTRPGGNKQEVRQLGPRGAGGTSRIGTIRVASGERYTESLLLNEWTEFEQAGVYQLALRLSKPIESEQGSALVAVRPFKVKLTILPRDERELAQRAAALASTIEIAQSTEEYRQAALALSYINDSIAVPFLARALRSGKFVEAEAAEGLERIGNTDAAQVLISAFEEGKAAHGDLESRRALRANLAEQALQRLLRKTSDEKVRDMIEHAVKRDVAAN